MSGTNQVVHLIPIIVVVSSTLPFTLERAPNYPPLPALPMVFTLPQFSFPLLFSGSNQPFLSVTTEIHPEQAPLGLIALLISRRALFDSIAHSFKVLHEMPYTKDIPAGLPDDLQQILRDLHISTARMFEEIQQTNRLLDCLTLYPPHAPSALRYP